MDASGLDQLLLRITEAGDDNQLTRKRLRKDTSAEAGRYRDCCVTPEAQRFFQ
jgi:hypothetical protein